MSTTIYKNVLLAGAGGTLGKYVLSALLEDGTFDVTVLSRVGSTSTFPSNVKVVGVDFTDFDAIKKALSGQDVVISAIGGSGTFDQLDHALIEASTAVGVKWFIPSEFTADLNHPLFASLPFQTPKVESIKLLKKYQSRLAHTFITTGAFLDWGLDNGFLGFDIPTRTATLYDEGKYLCSGATLSTIGKAVVATIRHPEITQNKRIYIADAIYTQQEVLTLFEKYSGAKWAVKHRNTKDTYQSGADSFSKGDLQNGIRDYIMATVYCEDGACNFQGKTSNHALQLPTVPLEQIVQEAFDRSKTKSNH